MHADEPIKMDDTVTCTTAYSKVSPLKDPHQSLHHSHNLYVDQVLPLEGGEIFVALTTGRPSMNNIQESEVSFQIF